MSTLEWSELDDKAVATARVLAMDSVEKAGDGHPGTAMALAPAAYVLFQKVMRFDPADTTWLARDKFVLSCGHASILQYVQQYYLGLLELDDLKGLRQFGSRTPAHPELDGHGPGIEITTGPLGTGFASAVGMAAAARRQRGLLEPEAPEGEGVFDHTVYVFASDGDMEEGVSNETASWAGTQQLDNLVVMYDSNTISIEGHTDIAFREDVGGRFESLGWFVQHVRDVNDVDGVFQALCRARDHKGAPAMVIVNSIIAWPAPKLQNTAKSHGSALGAEEVAATKKILGFDPAKDFDVAPEVLEHVRGADGRAKTMRAEWDAKYAAWREASADKAALLDRLQKRQLPDGWADAVPTWKVGDKDLATRSASGKVLSALADTLPELWGGSADLAGSNLTTMDGADSFLPETPYGRTLHFGIREFAMGTILNGIAARGLTRPYGGTFLCFSDFMRGAVRLAAIMHLPVTYVWTHDSIGLGGDGATHQPIEHLASLRAMPGLDVVRPGDANETAYAWKTVLERDSHPTGLILSRQNLPVLEGGHRRGGRQRRVRAQRPRG